MPKVGDIIQFCIDTTKCANRDLLPTAGLEAVFEGRGVSLPIRYLEVIEVKNNFFRVAAEVIDRTN